MYNFYLATRGLAKHESDLVAQQLKMLKNRTQYAWCFTLDPEAANAVITKSSSVDNPQGELSIPNLDFKKTDARVDWPIRLFGLLDILYVAEKHLVDNISSSSQQGTMIRAATLAQRFASLKEVTLVESAGLMYLIDPQQDKVWADSDDCHVLASRLCKAGVAHFNAKSDPAMPVGEHCVSFKALLWSLALREKPLAVRGWDLNRDQFQLSSWPLFSFWEKDSALIKLAALYSRAPTSLQRGVELTAFDSSYIAAFIHACEICQLGVKVTFGEKEVATPRSRHTPNSLFSFLRRKLGI